MNRIRLKYVKKPIKVNGIKPMHVDNIVESDRISEVDKSIKEKFSTSKELEMLAVTMKNWSNIIVILIDIIV